MLPNNQENGLTLSQAITSSVSFDLYGRPIKSGDLFSDFQAAQGTGEPWTLALIHSYSINGKCHGLQRAILLLLPGPGQVPDPEDKCTKKGDSKWIVIERQEVLLLDTEIGMLGNILESPTLKGINGGIQLSNPRISDGNICIDIHIWAEIKIAGKKVGFNEQFTKCVQMQGCHEVWSIGFANLKLCFRAPNQLCGQLCAGKWGIEKCWDYCVTIPIAATTDPTMEKSDNCNCKKN